MAADMATGKLVNFLAGDGCDSAGRTHTDVLAFDDAALERHHDYIQWLFPLAESSRAVPGSPVLDATSIAALRNSSVAQTRFAAAVARMMRFYERTDVWHRQFDHNHLRITRIIRCLRLLCDDTAADAFRAAILTMAAHAAIDAKARRFWTEA